RRVCPGNSEEAAGDYTVTMATTSYHTAPLSDTPEVHRKKSPAALLAAFLAIALVATVIAGMSKIRERDRQIAAVQAELATAKTEQTRVQGQLTGSLSQADALRKQFESSQASSKDLQGQFDQLKRESAMGQK